MTGSETDNLQSRPPSMVGRVAQPSEAEIWSQVRRMCFLRLRISSTGLSLTSMLMDETNQLKLAIDEELHNLESSG